MAAENNYSEEGNKNLLTLAKADNFTDWMYDEVKPYLSLNFLKGIYYSVVLVAL
ncbi:MAG: hypothetical protein PHF74_08100 [Dehalococcoidales bacterium]|nr:hypothetical protein [Dehalococcoidales bacterium]